MNIDYGSATKNNEYKKQRSFDIDENQEIALGP